MNWNNIVKECFGNDDHIFGGHLNERNQARKMIIASREQGDDDSDVLDECKKYLESKGCGEEFINSQMKRIDSAMEWID
jgi:hypothetical protein